MPADPSEPVPASEKVHADRSFAELYERQYRSVVRLAAALTGRWDVAEEIVQDAFLAPHERWTKVSTYDAPEAWLRRVVLNRALSTLRRRSIEARLAARLALRRSPRVDIPQPAGSVWKYVAALPKRQAEVVALVYVEDRTVAEVAAVLGCDENTVRTHLRRARINLARQLELDEEDQ